MGCCAGHVAQQKPLLLMSEALVGNTSKGIQRVQERTRQATKRVRTASSFP